MDETTFARTALRLRQTAIEACRKRGADEAEAEDIAQDVMLRLWQMKGELDNRRSPVALAAVMAGHLLADSRRKRRETTLTPRLMNVGSTDNGPQEQLEMSDDEQWLARRLGELPATQHAVLRMRQVEQRSTSDIALLLGIAESSVGTLLSRARQALLNEIRNRRK